MIPYVLTCIYVNWNHTYFSTWFVFFVKHQGRIQDLEQYTEVLKAAARIESKVRYCVCICLHAFVIEFFAHVNACMDVRITCVKYMYVHMCV